MYNSEGIPKKKKVSHCQHNGMFVQSKKSGERLEIVAFQICTWDLFSYITLIGSVNDLNVPLDQSPGSSHRVNQSEWWVSQVKKLNK